MKFDPSKLRKIREAKGYTQDQVATIINRTRSAVTKKEKGTAPISIDQLEKIAQEWSIDISEFFDFDGTEKIDTAPFILVPKYRARLSGGPGEYIYDQDIESHLVFKKSWLNGRCVGNGCALFAVKGDSMSPIITDGDVVLVDMHQNNPNEITDGKIYAFSEGDAVRVKRLERHGAAIWQRSDNKMEGGDPAPIEPDQFRLIGKVIWVGHEIK